MFEAVEEISKNASTAPELKDKDFFSDDRKPSFFAMFASGDATIAKPQ